MRIAPFLGTLALVLVTAACESVPYHEPVDLPSYDGMAGGGSPQLTGRGKFTGGGAALLPTLDFAFDTGDVPAKYTLKKVRVWYDTTDDRDMTPADWQAKAWDVSYKSSRSLSLDTLSWDESAAAPMFWFFARFEYEHDSKPNQRPRLHRSAMLRWEIPRLTQPGSFYWRQQLTEVASAPIEVSP